MTNDCRIRKIGDMGVARVMYCETCGISGLAYAYPHPKSNVRCFLTEPWPEDQHWMPQVPKLFWTGARWGLVVIMVVTIAVILYYWPGRP